MDAYRAIEEAAWEGFRLAVGLKARVKASAIVSAGERAAVARHVKATEARWHQAYVRAQREDERHAARVSATLAALDFGADDRP